MADIKVSALTDGGEALPTDDIPVNRGGASRRVRPPLPFGPYATLAALQTAYPASAALAGRHAYVGSAVPYTIYTCNGAAWAMGALGPYATAAALEAAYPSASNAGRFAAVGAAAPYAMYASTGSAWVQAVSITGNGPFGPYATAAALETAFPAATNTGRHGFVGSAAPYTIYTSNGTAWVIGALGPYATAAALETAFPSASNTGRFATVGSAAPYDIYVSNGAAWMLAVNSNGAATSLFQNKGSISGATAIDWSAGMLALLTLSAAATLSFTNTPATGRWFRAVLRVVTPGALAITWPTINWAGGAAPDISVAGTHEVALVFLNNGGTLTIDGAYVGKVA